jgi:hypothetical protein
MGSLKGRIKCAQQEVKGEGVLIELRDGSRRVFSDTEVFKEVFLTQMELFRGNVKPSEVLDAVRAATPESKAAFEEQYSPIEMRARVIEGGL